MKALMLAGFLGSGKTTLLLRVARHLTAQGQTVAIIENEIGEIGVDGEVVSELGMPVRELFGGCICCTLQVGMVETLRDIEEKVDPDWVIIEPTGLAGPADLVELLRTYLPHLETHVVTLVDAERWEMLIEVLEPLMEAQLGAAELVAVTKVDAVDGETLARVEAAVRAKVDGVPLCHLTASDGDGIHAILETLR